MAGLQLSGQTVLLGVGGAFAAAYVLSELRYQRQSGAPFRTAVAHVASHDPQRVEQGLAALGRLIDEDRANDVGAKGMVIDGGLATVVGVLAAKDALARYPRTTLSLALKLLTKCCDEPAGRRRAAGSGAVVALLRLLAEMSHVRSDGPQDVRLMEDLATALLALTVVDPAKIILPGDTPEGSEGAVRLLRSKNLDKILEMVTFDARSTPYITAMVKCFANISHLSEGVVRLREAGAVTRMPLLLQKPVIDIKEASLMVLRNLVKRDAAARSEFFQQDPAQILSPFLQPQHQKHAKIISNAMHILGDLLYRGTRAETQALEDRMVALGMFDALAAALGKDLPKATRDLVEEVLKLALEANPPPGGKEVELEDKPWIRDPLREHAPAISRRRKLDQEEARQRLQEQQKQRQMMEMMAMQHMMGGGEGGMEEMLAAMGGMGGMGGMGFEE